MKDEVKSEGWKMAGINPNVISIWKKKLFI
jgi:hypothetical protein